MSARCSKRNWDPNQPIRTGNSSASKNCVEPGGQLGGPVVEPFLQARAVLLEVVRTAWAAVIETGCCR
ncbi:hypothetical protein SMICM304S_09503 [Streptomyces microflavus]